MGWFDNMPLGKKLMAGFILIALIAGAIGWLGISTIHEVEVADTKLYQKITVPINDLGDIATAFQGVRINLRDLVEAGNAQDRQKAQDTIKQLRTTIDEKSTAFGKTILTEEDRKQFDQFKKTRTAYGRVIDRVVPLAMANKDAEAMTILKGEGKQAAFDENAAIDKLQESKIKQAELLSGENAATASAATKLMIALIAIGVVLAAGLGIFITSVVQGQLGGDPLEVLAIARRVSIGDLSMSFNMHGKRSDSVLAAMQKMAETIKALVADASMLSDSAIAARLATRADGSRRQGEFQKRVVRVTKAQDVVIGSAEPGRGICGPHQQG